MSKLAEELRRRTTASVRALPVSARIELALRLGDDDLARFVEASGLDPEVALCRLRATRRRGRTPSASAGTES